MRVARKMQGYGRRAVHLGRGRHESVRLVRLGRGEVRDEGRRASRPIRRLSAVRLACFERAGMEIAALNALGRIRRGLEHFIRPARASTLRQRAVVGKDDDGGAVVRGYRMRRERLRERRCRGEVNRGVWVW